MPTSSAAACHEDAGRSEGEDVESDRVRDVPPGLFLFGHIKSFLPVGIVCIVFLCASRSYLSVYLLFIVKYFQRSKTIVQMCKTKQVQQSRIRKIRKCEEAK